MSRPNLPAAGDRAGPREAASRYLDVLFGAAPEGLLIELRFRVGSEMRRRFFPAARPDAAVPAILALAWRTDIFVGVLPRVRRRGRREDVVAEAGVVWADCDTPRSAAALASFIPRPSIAVASGSARHRHAYWLLRDPIGLDALEALNRRLALALGADLGAVTGAQTILRPPGTRNMKHAPPAAVRLIGVREDRRVGPAELDRLLPREQTRDGSPATPSRPSQDGDDDRLRSVPPPVYFERLTGLRVGPSGKVRCPFHHDRTPSLHVYAEPGRGWYCYGCGRGGSIYDLAALVWRRPAPRGQDFVEMRRELEALVR